MRLTVFLFILPFALPCVLRCLALPCLQGYLPDAMINYLALLGWNDGTDKDIYTRQELIDSFDLNRVTASPAQFDQVCQCVESSV